MILTEKGEELFKQIEPNINNLLEIEKTFLNTCSINFGTYNTLISKMISECINKYYKKNRKNKINIINAKIEDMLYMLLNSEIDIVLSKRVSEDLYDNKQIKYIRLGELQEVIITNNNSKLNNRKIDFKDLKDEIIYIPRNNTVSILKFIRQIEKYGFSDNIKRIDSSTMIKLLKKGSGIGIITKEYVKEEIENKKISILETKFNLENSELGIYKRKEYKSKILEEFINLLKQRFEEYN